MDAKIILITGANTGIGFETVRALLQSARSYKILLAGRSVSNVEQAIEKANAEFPDSKSTIHPFQIDVCDDASIQAAFDKVSTDFGKVDVLLNNAGASFDNTIMDGRMTMREGWAASYDVNVTGAHIMTETFVPLLLKSDDPRLLFVTSGTSSLAETEDDAAPINKSPAAGWPKMNFRSIISYRTSKVGLNMLMREWQRILKPDGVKCFCVAPGFLATGLGGEDLRKFGAGEPSLGGISLRKVIEGERDGDVGKVVRNYSTPVQPW